MQHQKERLSVTPDSFSTMQICTCIMEAMGGNIVVVVASKLLLRFYFSIQHEVLLENNSLRRKGRRK